MSDIYLGFSCLCAVELFPAEITHLLLFTHYIISNKLTVCLFIYGTYGVIWSRRLENDWLTFLYFMRLITISMLNLHKLQLSYLWMQKYLLVENIIWNNLDNIKYKLNWLWLFLNFIIYHTWMCRHGNINIYSLYICLLHNYCKMILLIL